MPNLDLNAKRAERAAKRGELFTVELGDQSFELVAEMPLGIASMSNANDMAGVVRQFLAHPEQDYDRFMAANPSFDDILAVVEFYGVSLGESMDSIVSSANTGRPSRPTSNGSTVSTLPNAVTAQDSSTPVG